jgi:hypothetical protein
MTSCTDIIAPLAQAEESAVAPLPSVNYTNQDFSSLKTRLTLFIQQRFPNFADFTESDFGLMLIENWAFIGDMLSFKADQIANENYIGSVTQLDNAFKLAQNVGFQPTPPIAASALFSATISVVLQTDLVIPSGLQISVPTNGAPMTYELFAADALNNPIFNQDIIIPAGSFNNNSIVGLEGATIVENFTSDGSANQILTLTTVPALFDSVMVSVDGTNWTEVNFFTDSQPRQEYMVQFSSLWQAFVIFGNGTGGAIPSPGSAIVVTYRTGGGTRGNIVSGSVVSQTGFQVPGFNIFVPVTFQNYTAGMNGYAGDTIENIRNELPSYINSQNRAVTGDDYVNLTSIFVTPYNGQIGKATAVLRNSGCAGNIIDLYILARNGTDGLQPANDQLKVELNDYLQTVKMLTDFVCIKDGVILSVDTLIDVTVSKFFRKFQDQILSEINQVINNFYALPNWNYGESLQNTDIITALASIQQITSSTVSFTTNDPNRFGDLITTQYFEIIRPDTTTITINYV